MGFHDHNSDDRMKEFSTIMEILLPTNIRSVSSILVCVLVMRMPWGTRL